MKKITFAFIGLTFGISYAQTKSNSIYSKIIDLKSSEISQNSNAANPFDYLDTNNVNAIILGANIKHNNSGQARYAVPKTNSWSTNISANYATSLWLGGYDSQNQLHIAAETYRQKGRDFWPGPLDTTTANSTITNNVPYDKVWKHSCNQINKFVLNYNSNNVSANSGTSFTSINNFIPNGSNSNNFAKQLYPYKDWNSNGIYEPSQGEYPIIKGHQQLYSVYNDAMGAHGETGGLPLGVEVHDRSFSFNEPTIHDSMKVINHTTFYNFEIINRSNNNYNNFYVTMWVDADLGYYLNDYIGSDSLNNFGYVYNGNNEVGYNYKSPIMGYALIQQPSAQTDGIDNNNNGQIDEPNENFKLNCVSFYNNNIGPVNPNTNNPNLPIDYYNYMRALWKDGSAMRPIANGYAPTSTLQATKYAFAGNPQTNTGWTEQGAGNIPGDRRILVSVGPFNFPSKKKVEVEFAHVFSRDTNLINVNNNLSLLKKDVSRVRYYLAQANNCQPIALVGLKEIPKTNLSFWMYPNPSSNEVFINLNNTITDGIYTVYDILGNIVLKNRIANTTLEKINVSSLKEGIYFVEIADGSQRAINKFIKGK